ncbi:MAG: hypothetical protein DRP11_00150 [Candidatus Aenigmatarchaeota archaeon]|nr:MAG: hypothetical protein DRP11_00150 [Candidatus Aenigmarchaeota archaeon]
MKNEQDKNKEGRSAITVSVTSGSFPIQLFQEWEEDCKRRFGHCRWMKMWSDHLAAKQLSIIQDLMEQIKELDRRISMLESNPNEKKDKEILTLGGVEK